MNITKAELLSRQRQLFLKTLIVPRNIPQDSPTLTVAMSETPKETLPMKGFGVALEWREAQKGLGSQPLLKLVSSTPGTGKTVALAWYCLRHPLSALYVDAGSFFAYPKNGWSENQEKWRDWESVDLLCIDDLGTGTGKDPQAIGALILRRWDHGFATLIAANISWQDFVSHYMDEGTRVRFRDRVSKMQSHPSFEGFKEESLRGL